MDLDKHQNSDHAMLTQGFKINECDRCVHIKNMKNYCILVCLYVDDMVIMGINKDAINSTTKMLNSNFDMKKWVKLMSFWKFKLAMDASLLSLIIQKNIKEV